MTSSDITIAQQRIWQLIGSTKNDTVENARCRLIVGIVSSAANFDEQYAEMVYHWAKIVGIKDELVTAAIKSEVVRCNKAGSSCVSTGSPKATRPALPECLLTAARQSG
jgi:hypothetical protein